MPDRHSTSIGDGDVDKDIRVVTESSNILATASLDDLQSKEYRNVLDTVDRLRTCGLGSILPLPQLVVCGNQSSGKSSVLEAITEVPFPRKENLCTRFATEIILRRDHTESLRTKIIPDKSRTDDEISKLKSFNETIHDFTELPKLIEKATDLMGLNNVSANEDGNRAFSRDVLSIEIAGPGRPQLTLVDLPGLIASANKSQTKADIELIHSLVSDYLKEKRTIMLAVISAKDDYANQGIITKCRDVDPDGHRTLGIITKPDYLRAGSSNEQQWLDLARNTDVYFELGWHMLKNRTEDEVKSSFKARNASESAFFAKGKYQNLSEKDKGIAALRTKLSGLLFRHLKKELPNLQADLNAKHLSTSRSLADLGEKRSTPAEQRRFLMNIAASYQNVINSAIKGNYQHAFFGSIDTSKWFEDASNIKRLRAAVQYLNLQFASQMRQYGHKYRIWATKDTAGTNAEDDLPEPELHEEYTGAKDGQMIKTFDEAVDWVKSILIRTRGQELPGNYNPFLMSQLFWEQSERWVDLCRAHVDRVDARVSQFVTMAINDVTLNNVSSRLQGLKINDALKLRRGKALEELNRLVDDKQRQPITYNPAYTKDVQESRSKRTHAKILRLMDQAKVDVKQEGEEHAKSLINPDLLKNQLAEIMDPDMDKISTEDALVSQIAYYKEKSTYFIAAVTDQVIERHLLHGLAESTLSPLMINDMTDDEVSHVAAEAESIVNKREYLESHKQILETGQAAFRQAMGSYK